MQMNYPDFLNAESNRKSIGSNTSKDTSKGSPPSTISSTTTVSSNGTTNSSKSNEDPIRFNNMLFNGLSTLDETQAVDILSPPHARNYYNCFDNINPPKRDTFNLPRELQGGVNNISSRRPSYAAESFTRNTNFPAFGAPNLSIQQSPGEFDSQHQPPQVPKTANSSKFFNSNKSFTPSFSNQLPMVNTFSNPNAQFQYDQFSDNFANMNINTNFNNFQSSRPTQQVQQQQEQQPSQQGQQQSQQQSPGTQKLSLSPGSNNFPIRLENGLILKDKYIIASSDRLKSLFLKTMKYFQDPAITAEILTKLNALLMNPVIIKLVTFIKNLNNLTFNHKILCLVINKNGKFDLLSYPNNSNILLQKNDLVISDGDRGKDLVMIVEPLVNLDFAILFNFLKKVEHLKSLTIQDNAGKVGNRGQVSKSNGGTHSTLLNASSIITSHSNEDNEFIITLPTKQVLRFATPAEVHKISGKFLEEKKAFITCYNKIKELNLESNLTLINVEYQSDLKKLIFYYFAGFKRIDFRGLIKELFKIYKTRIWLCAVLPFDKPETYITMKKNQKVPEKNSEEDIIPREYDLSNEQILNFSINEFDNLASPNYFHSINLLNLIEHLNNELEGYFYGFNSDKKTTQPTTTPNQKQQLKQQQQQQSQQQGVSNEPYCVEPDRSRVLPYFDPFGDAK
ncbi:uncharacterized protein SPAPADRAFT_146024 [Spathaspora passalidarum NRRL Y-27907]|uniref:PSP1 C-terminal domain-containing protein n=1 Tax=Spathaspora passalidarum (strain NRRL Y-27907 / 11-Y1) TaxID=619300 RepID=G3AFY1_SPAPN|nr:uncharacterized protein SPAPADRAFT_146024 [Spathaspora passalidarum NRRL Y-27907]EGW35120.1 hypothetical protein SPAPADRAFT_146024 [Spathaspora passalidarum NRRL Y-27907]